MPIPLLAALALQTALTSPDDPRIASTLQRYCEATRTFDVAALDKLFWKDYVEVSPVGEVDDRAKTLEAYRVAREKQTRTPDAIAVKELSIRYPQRDIAIGIYCQSMSFGSNALNVRTTTVLRKEKGEWFLISNQFTVIRAKS